MSTNPGIFQWSADIAIPLVAALASIGVLVWSVKTARSARDQAEATEQARLDAEAERSNVEHEGAMRKAYAAIFKSISVLSARLGEAAPPNALFIISDRSDFDVLADIAVARLEARTPDEVRLIDRIRKLILETRDMFRPLRGWVVTEVWHLVILWHDSDEEFRNSVILPRFDELAKMTPQSSVPEWAGIE
ncbi:hypothetical protein ACIQXM_01885 [Arthrobacter sp. NPDC097144]|uniref:hypothetical protein n=1 Tax=Arthrobacter sp. NPDC097144 TaxID=3363946 RepID=UPI003807263C